MGEDDPSSEEDEEVVGESSNISGHETSFILSEVLCYMQYHIKRTVNTNILEVITRHFSMEEISQARDILLKYYGNDVKHLLKHRRNTHNKNKSVSMCEDLMKAIRELDEKGITTNFVAMNLGRLPRCDPKDIDPYAMMQLLVAIDERLKVAEDGIGETKAQLFSHEDKLKSLNDKVETHEMLITNQMTPTPPSYCEMLKKVTNGNSGSDSDADSTNPNTNSMKSRDTQQDCEIQDSGQDRPWTTVGRHRQRNTNERQNPRNKNATSENDQRQPQSAMIRDKGNGQQRRRTSVQHLRSSERRRQNAKVTGSLESEVIEGAPPPKRDFFLSRVKRDTQDDMMKSYIISKGINLVNLEVVSNPDARFKSYKLSVSVNDKEKVMSPNVWPVGICVQKWLIRNSNNRDFNANDES